MHNVIMVLDILAGPAFILVLRDFGPGQAPPISHYLFQAFFPLLRRALVKTFSECLIFLGQFWKSVVPILTK